jgi:hypothetical protein
MTLDEQLLDLRNRIQQQVAVLRNTHDVSYGESLSRTSSKEKESESLTIVVREKGTNYAIFHASAIFRFYPASPWNREAIKQCELERLAWILGSLEGIEKAHAITAKQLNTTSMNNSYNPFKAIAKATITKPRKRLESK